jgi:hypothetical protein
MKDNSAAVRIKLIVLPVIITVLLSSPLISFEDVFVDQGKAPNRTEPFARFITFVDAYWSNDGFTRLEVEPGDGTVALAVVLGNAHNLDIGGISGNLWLPIGLKAPGKPIGQPAFIGFPSTVETGGTFALLFPVEVLKDAKIGTHYATLELTFAVAKTSQVKKETLNVPFRVTGKSILNIKPMDEVLTAGIPSALKIAIVNNGTAPVSGAILTLTSFVTSSTAELVSLGSNTFNIGMIEPNEVRIVEPVLYADPILANTMQNVKVQLAYYDVWGIRKTLDTSLRVVINPADAANFSKLGYSNIELLEYNFDPQLVFPGDKPVTVQILFQNRGSSPINNVKAVLNASPPIRPLYEGSTIEYLGVLQPGVPREALFYLDVPLQETLRIGTPFESLLELKISYNTNSVQEFQIPFKVLGRADIVVTDVEQSPMTAGDGATRVTVHVKNIGGETAKFITFMAQTSNYATTYVYPGVNPAIQFMQMNQTIGYLRSGEEQSVSYVLQLSTGTTRGSYPLTLLYTWEQDNAVKKFADTLTVNVKVETGVLEVLLGETFAGIPTLIPIILAPIPIAFVLRKQFRRFVERHGDLEVDEVQPSHHEKG